MIKRQALFLCLLLTLVASFNLEFELDSQYVPVSRRYPGIQIKGANEVVTVQLIYDPTCDGSAAFDQVIRSVSADLESQYPGKFTYRFAINALPYHISSFKIAQAIKYVNDKKGPAAALQIYRYFLDNIDKYDEKAVLQISIVNSMNNIAQAVSTRTGLGYDDLRKEIMHYASTDGETRKWTKYVMGTLRIPGTPFIFINGARLDNGTSMTAAQLKELLIKLL